jgi:hypothetical protein
MLSNYSSQSKALGTHTMKIAYELSSILPLIHTAAMRRAALIHRIAALISRMKNMRNFTF